MLKTFRNNAQSPFFKAMLWVLIVSFSAFGLGGVASFVNSSAMSVDGKAYSTQDLANDAYQVIQQQEADNLASNDISNIVQSVAQQKAYEMSLQNEAESKGFSATDDAVRNSVRSNRQFWVNGQFDQSRYEAYLKQINKREPHYLRDIRKGLSVSQLTAASVAGMDAPEAYLDALEQQTAKLARKISVKYVPIDTSDITLDITASDEQISQYYNQNTESFRLPEYRNIELFSVGAEDYKAKNPDANFNQDATSLMESIEDDIGAGVSFADIAANRGGVVQDVSIDGQSLDENGISVDIGGEQVLNLIANAAVGIPTPVILVSQGNQSKLYGALVKEVIPSRIASLDKVKAQIKSQLEEQARSQALQAFAQKVVDDAKNKGSLEAIAGEFKNEIQSKEKLTASMLATSISPFASSDTLSPLLLGNVGDIQPVSLANRWYVMETTAFEETVGDELKQAAALQKQFLDSSYGISVANAFATDIRSIHKVKIKPSILDDITKSLATEAQ
ncbi:MAG: SurA N-terminal domain-containing protein [Alphaproteobacteria bacterium]